APSTPRRRGVLRPDAQEAPVGRPQRPRARVAHRSLPNTFHDFRITIRNTVAAGTRPPLPLIVCSTENPPSTLAPTNVTAAPTRSQRSDVPPSSAAADVVVPSRVSKSLESCGVRNA